MEVQFHLLLTLFLKWTKVCAQLHTSAGLPPAKYGGKQPRYPPNRRLAGHQSQFGRLKNKIFLDPTGNRSADYPVFSLVKLTSIPVPLLGGHGGRNPCIPGFRDSIFTCCDSCIFRSPGTLMEVAVRKTVLSLLGSNPCDWHTALWRFFLEVSVGWRNWLEELCTQPFVTGCRNSYSVLKATKKFDRES